MLRLRARRLGPFIRDYLDLQGEAWVMDVWRAWRGHLLSNGYQPPQYRSFSFLFHVLKRSGAITFTRAEPVPTTSPEGRARVLFESLSVDVTAPTYDPSSLASPAPRHYYRLVDPSHEVFDDPWRWYRANLGLLPRLPSAQPSVMALPPFAPAPPRVAPAIPSFELGDRPGRRAAQQFLTHLRRLEALGVDTPEVDQELERLEGELQGWQDQGEEAVSLEEEKEEPNEDRLERLQEQRDALEEAVSALGDRDIGLAMDALNRAFPPRAASPAIRTSQVFEARAKELLPRIDLLARSPSFFDIERLESAFLALSRDLGEAIEVEQDASERAALESLEERIERSTTAFVQIREGFERRNTQTGRRLFDRGIRSLRRCCLPS